MKFDLSFLRDMGIRSDEFRKLVDSKPLLFDHFYPRRYAEPKGWYSPKVYALTAALTARDITLGFIKHTHNIAAEAVIDALLSTNRVPTWFVGAELFEALLDTEPPSNFRFVDIKWPAPALLFMLPIEASRKVFNRNITSLAVARAAIGEAVFLPKVPGLAKRHEIFIARRQTNRDSMFHMKADSYWLNGNPDGGYSHRVPFDSETTLEELEPEKQMVYDTQARQEPDDLLQITRLSYLAMQLLLVLGMEQSGMQTGGEMTMPGISKGKGPTKQVIRPALFRPKWVGENYRRPKAPPQGGHHASPVVHLRCGHWRQQRYGAGLAEVKAIWIEPTWVNAAA